MRDVHSCGELQLPGAGAVRAHPGRNRSRHADIYRWSRNADGGAERSRICRTYGYPESFFTQFADTAVGALSAAQTISLTNAGDVPLTAINVSVSGAFQVSSSCGTQLAGHAACTIGVVFAPTQPGSQSGVLTVSDALRTQTAVLTGTGLAPPALSVNPSSLSFSMQQPGVPSAPQTVTVSNTGGAPMANVGFQITGPAAASYLVGATTCGSLLNGGGSCTVQVVFTPAVTGAIAAVLTSLLRRLALRRLRCRSMVRGRYRVGSAAVQRS